MFFTVQKSIDKNIMVVTNIVMKLSIKRVENKNKKIEIERNRM